MAMHPGQLLVSVETAAARRLLGRLPVPTPEAGVIDVGSLAPADPALDHQPAWNLLDASARAAYRDALGVSDDEWERGKGWAFAQAIGCLAYYRVTNPQISRTADRTLRALLDDAASVSTEAGTDTDDHS
ncbi:MAG: hypothetical protein ACR2JD_06525 [Nocardioides sp.]